MTLSLWGKEKGSKPVLDRLTSLGAPTRKLGFTEKGQTSRDVYQCGRFLGQASLARESMCPRMPSSLVS